ncbi:MAG TPA: glycosyltransferase family 2 protein [Pirellulales bacterium]|nr:glycosyltransferase family 2 protein [Pirellulales bacterium]
METKDKGILMEHSLSVVIPALNEAGNIQGSIDSVTYAAEKHFDDYEIIIVNDGSTDQTLEIIQANIGKNPRIRVLSHDKPWGFGASYHDGRRQATKDYTVMVHGDNAFDKDTLSNFFSHVGEAEVICGYIANPAARSWTRRGISFAYTTTMNILFCMRLKYFNGLQIHKTAWLRQLNASSDGFGFQAELLIKAIKEGNTYVQVPTIHTERPGGGETKIFKMKNIRSVVRTMAGLYVWNIKRILSRKRS